MSLYYIEAFDDSKAPNEQQTPLIYKQPYISITQVFNPYFTWCSTVQGGDTIELSNKAF